MFSLMFSMAATSEVHLDHMEALHLVWKIYKPRLKHFQADRFAQKNIKRTKSTSRLIVLLRMQRQKETFLFRNARTGTLRFLDLPRPKNGRWILFLNAIQRSTRMKTDKKTVLLTNQNKEKPLWRSSTTLTCSFEHNSLRVQSNLDTLKSF